MNDPDLNTMLDDLAGYWPRLGQQISAAPKLLLRWSTMLRRYPRDLVEATMARCADTAHTPPTPDAFLATMDREVQPKRRYDSPGDLRPGHAPIVAEIARLSSIPRTDDEMLWARLHVALFEKLTGRSEQEKREMRAVFYQQAKTTYPAVASWCEVQLGRMQADA